MMVLIAFGMLVKAYIPAIPILLVVRWYRRKLSVVKCVAGRYARREPRLNDCTKAVIE
jgi:hypothetical protein